MMCKVCCILIFSLIKVSLHNISYTETSNVFFFQTTFNDVVLRCPLTNAGLFSFLFSLINLRRSFGALPEKT